MLLKAKWHFCYGMKVHADTRTDTQAQTPKLKTIDRHPQISHQGKQQLPQEMRKQ